jgi:histidyl-tRNA synthetase
MHDLLPPDSERWRALVERFAEHAERAGYGYIQTPVLEELAVFGRVGEGTDVVTKEMYDFDDRDGTRVALRPESTAGVARSFIQHRPLVPWKVWYASQHFRHEKPQAGRFRQHHQFGAECFGSADPDVDVEIIVVLWDFFRSVGLSRLRLEVNSIGEPAARARYQHELRSFLAGRAGDLAETDRAKIDTHPLRVLDSKDPATQAALDGAPTLMASMDDASIAHFERVQAGLGAAGIDVVVNPRLVRGLDYYTHTVFEIVSDALESAQSTIGGGGRYDGLVEALGGPPTPGVGFGAGIERILLACDAEGAFAAPPAGVEVFVVGFGGDGSDVRDLVLALRRDGFAADRAYGGRSPKAQMKQADRSGARFAVIVGDDERAAGTYVLRDLRSDAQGDAAQVTIPQGSLTGELLARR